MIDDPIEEFEHDHADTTRQVLALAQLVTEIERGAVSLGVDDHLVRSLVELRDDLFTHFAREEEGLFPYVLDNLPALAGDIEALITGHDAICGSLARMVHLAQAGERADVLVTIYRRFEVAYATHAGAERGMLQRVGAALSPAQRAALADAVQALS